MIWITTITVRKYRGWFSNLKREIRFKKIFFYLGFCHTLVVEKENQLLDLVIIAHYHYHQVNYEEELLLMFD